MVSTHGEKADEGKQNYYPSQPGPSTTSANPRKRPGHRPDQADGGQCRASPDPADEPQYEQRMATMTAASMVK